jgi:hypothetical protein
VVREGGDWWNNDDCNCDHHPGESSHSRRLSAEFLSARLVSLPAFHWMSLSCDLGPFRDLHLQLLLPPLPLSIVNLGHVHGITSDELRLTSSHLFAAHAFRFVVITLGERDAGSVRLFSCPAQQPVRGAGEGDAGGRGVDLAHRTLLAVVPSTDSQTPPLWEDKPPCPFGRGLAAEVRKVSLAIVSCLCVFYWSRTCCVSLLVSIVLALG